jgi:Omp85 superfamily domain
MLSLHRGIALDRVRAPRRTLRRESPVTRVLRLLAILPLSVAVRQTDAFAQEGPALQRSAWYIYPVPTSERLTGLKLTLIAAHLWRAAMDGTTRPSTVYFDGAVTTKHQLLLAVGGDLWAPENRRSLSFLAGYSRFPAPFYGIGPRTAESRGELYTPHGFLATITGERELWHHLRLQSGLLFQRATIVQRAPNGILIGDSITGSSGYTVVAPQIGLVYDTRDRVFDPGSGIFIQARGLVSLTWLGASSGYQSMLLDGRIYHRVRQGSVFATQLAFEGVRGAVPFDQLPQLGANALRAYVYGRWRDRTLLRGQVEWRQHLFWRFGGVAFAAAGVVGPDPGALPQEPIRSTSGLGLRFKLSSKEDANFSADYARASHASEITFRFAEAF